jgi:hypothetical protein
VGSLAAEVAMSRSPGAARRNGDAADATLALRDIAV